MQISNSFPVEEVIAIAEVAGDAILEVYNGEASAAAWLNILQREFVAWRPPG